MARLIRTVDDINLTNDERTFIFLCHIEVTFQTTFQAKGGQLEVIHLYFRPDGEIGRRKGLKIPRPLGRAGSTPAPGTNISPSANQHPF